MILKIFNNLFFIAPDRIAKNGVSKYFPAINNPAIITIAVIIVLNLKKLKRSHFWHWPLATEIRILK